VKADADLTAKATRPTKLGAKNWILVGRDTAGEKTAILYTELGNLLVKQAWEMSNHATAAVEGRCATDPFRLGPASAAVGGLLPPPDRW
jgi:hypothetical protein